MRHKAISLLLTSVLLVIVFLSGGCKHAPALTTELPITQIPGIPTTILPTAYPITPTLPAPTQVPKSEVATQTFQPSPIQPTQPISPTNNPPTQTQPMNIPQAGTEQKTATPTVIEFTSVPTIVSNPAYPGPENPTTFNPYPGPENSATIQPTLPNIDTVTPAPGTSQTPIKSATSSITVVGTVAPTKPSGFGTPSHTPVEPPLHPPISPPPAGSNVTIWHSWGTTETEMLKSIVKSFQRSYPNVNITLKYYPQDALLGAFYEAAYFGQGPALLLGPSTWGAQLYQEDLILNLTPYIPAGYLADINAPALVSGQFHNSQISLPLSLSGVLMFRNTSIIPNAPSSFDELSEMSHQATHGGVVGSYLELGSYFSSPAIIGLGGRIMDTGDNPAFDDAFGLEWLDLLSAYDQAGAVTFNTNNDLDMFRKGRVGIIIDGSWNIAPLGEAIGTDKLAIDAWPTYGDGHLSGWVQADSVYLNANSLSNDRYAALSFIGYLLDPDVQMRLAEVGHIPAVISTQPRDIHIAQAVQAFSNSAPYPASSDAQYLNIYWSELDKVIHKVLENGVDPVTALHEARINIRNILNIIKNSRTAP